MPAILVSAIVQLRVLFFAPDRELLFVSFFPASFSLLRMTIAVNAVLRQNLTASFLPALERGRFCAINAAGETKDLPAFAAVSPEREFRLYSVHNALQFAAAVSNAVNPAREFSPDCATNADTARRKKNASSAARYFAEARQ